MTESMNLADKYPGVIAEFEKEMEKMHVPTPNWPLPGEFWVTVMIVYEERMFYFEHPFLMAFLGLILYLTY